MNRRYLQSLPETWLPIADVLSALGDETRQKILLLFEPGEELSIKEIVEVMPLSRTATVHHLNVLERAKVLRSRKKGRSVLYSVEAQQVLLALGMLQNYILEEYGEIEVTTATAVSKKPDTPS